MQWEEAQCLATSAVTTVPTAHGVQHTFVGGFAVQSLRNTCRTEDIDVVVDINVSEPASRERIVPRLIEADSRYSMGSSTLFFTSSETSANPVPIEMLPVGLLGLPPTLHLVHLADCDGPNPIPILRPSVLVLTKVKRCVHFIGSTRPKSRLNFKADRKDIKLILLYWVEHSEKIGSASYSSPNPERMYKAVGDHLQYYRSEEVDDMVDTLMSVLEESDLERVNST